MLKIIGLLAGLLAIVSYLPYTKDILNKKVKPERASWLIWSILASIAFFSQLSKGARQSLWFTGLDSIGAFVTLALSIKFGLGSVKRRDVFALIFAGIGLIIWFFTHNAIYALLITMAVDVIGVTLTVWKTFEHPDTETYPMWLIICLASVLAIISVGKFNATLMVYPFYIFLANFAVVMAIYFGSKAKRTK